MQIVRRLVCAFRKRKPQSVECANERCRKFVASAAYDRTRTQRGVKNSCRAGHRVWLSVRRRCASVARCRSRCKDCGVRNRSRFARGYDGDGRPAAGERFAPKTFVDVSQTDLQCSLSQHARGGDGECHCRARRRNFNLRFIHRWNRWLSLRARRNRQRLHRGHGAHVSADGNRNRHRFRSSAQCGAFVTAIAGVRTSRSGDESRAGLAAASLEAILKRRILMRTTSKRIAYAALVLGALFAFILIFSSLPVNAAETKVTFVHFADYHSHAVPFYSEGKVNQGGLARTIAYLKQAKASLPNPIILNGGDTMNSGTPSWSDKYQCTEWPMFNGLLDAMAVGNHEFDYGWDAFLKCRDSARYPIISANLIYSTTNQPVLLSNNKPYAVKQVGDVKIGLFALSGPDFARLVSRKNLADNVTFGENLATAKQIVSALRNEEKVNAVVFFGHGDRESDFAMAQQVPGINLILGTHSHFKGELQKIEGTNTYFISPFQYLTYLSQVEMTFTDGKVSNVTGKLVKMDESITPDPTVDAQIAQMQKDLEADPKYAPKFVKIGQASVELSVEGIDKGESVLGDFVMDILRRTAKANAAFSTASSFRASIPPGPVRMEDYLTALPYKNVIMVYDLTGAQVK